MAFTPKLPPVARAIFSTAENFFRKKKNKQNRTQTNEQSKAQSYKENAIFENLT